MIGESRSYGCGPHRSTTCHGARVARQRCPILRAGEGNFIHLRVEFQTLFHLDFCVMQRYPFRLDFCVMQHAGKEGLMALKYKNQSRIYAKTQVFWTIENG